MGYSRCHSALAFVPEVTGSRENGGAGLNCTASKIAVTIFVLAVAESSTVTTSTGPRLSNSRGMGVGKMGCSWSGGADSGVTSGLICHVTVAVDGCKGPVRTTYLNYNYGVSSRKGDKVKSNLTNCSHDGV